MTSDLKPIKETILKILSIITVNYNNAPGLQKTIGSVFAQIFKNFEYIIIDGGSTDGSLAIIESVKDKTTYWVSEQDKGIYNAMNKGIAVAKGEYLYFLNSGDELVENALQKIFENKAYDSHFIIGEAKIGNHIFRKQKKLTLFDIFYIGINHQSFFMKKDVFEIAGLYQEKYKITADSLHFISSLLKYNLSYIVLDVLVAIIEPGGVSTNSIDSNMQERYLYLQNEHPVLLNDYKELYRYRKLKIVSRIINTFKYRMTKNG